MSRRGCHLCELMIEELVPLCRDELKLVVLDVDENPAWRELYGLRVPVLLYEGRVVCEGRLQREAVLAILALGTRTGPPV